jgi:hypothetical protein
MHLRSVLLLALLGASTTVACSSGDSSGGTAPTTDSGTAKSDTGTSTDAPPAEPCSEPASERPAGSQCVKTVTGKAVDTTGAPLPKGKLVSVCGQVCYFGETLADGTYKAQIGKYIKLGDFAASVHGRPEYASLYEKLGSSTAEDIVLPTLVLPKLPATGDKLPLDDKGFVVAATTLVAGDVTLSIPAMTEVELDLEDVALGEEGKLFRAVKVETKDFPTFAKDPKIAALYAATPFDAKFKNKVAVTIVAPAGLADGTAVEIVGLGNDFLRSPFTAGSVQVIATGKVAGGRVVTDAGQGLEYLTWIGVRTK